MRILFDCCDKFYKKPSGTIVPGEFCVLQMRIPAQIQTVSAELILHCDRTGEDRAVPFALHAREDDYELWRCEFSIDAPDLYFYWFVIMTKNERFRLFRYGAHDTNIEDGEKWQLSCVSDRYAAPDWARGAVLYQILPDRFCRAGQCDCKDKLQPYTVHEREDEPVCWQPDESGNVLNNDFYGGNFAGITEKLPYLASLGVGVVYLNPIFMAYSSHRYDTCDYKRVDPMLGTDADFQRLRERAHELGIRVVLDGVFSHTGSNSVYFDRFGIFGNGAYSNPDSPYRSWYEFQQYPDRYTCWWDFETLPCVRELEESYVNYIIEDEDSVVAKWIGLGADGFRLDVADELPDAFIARLRRRLRELKPDSLLLGEVWEDASNKIAYSVRRRYFVDGELDGVMNYPWRAAIIRFCRGEDDGTELQKAIETLAEHYPKQVLDCVMNLISSHDVSRAITELAAPFSGTREQMAAHRLSPEQRSEGICRLKLAAALQYALPGMPAIYYGDEAGMEGCKDPFNRAFYPWGREDRSLVDYYKLLGKLRKESKALRLGDISVLRAGGGSITILRRYGEETAEITVSARERVWTINGEQHEIG